MFFRQHHVLSPNNVPMYIVEEGRKGNYAGPSSLIPKLASQCPISTAAFKSLPCTKAARNPPAKASLRTQLATGVFRKITQKTYPAPLVSTISFESTGLTGWLVTTGSALPTTTIVGSVPWVITTVRGREGFFFGSIAMALAIAAMSLDWVGLLVVVTIAGAGKLTSRLWDSA